MNHTNLNEALRLQKIGWSIFPVGTDKKPLVIWTEFQNRIASESEITEWFNKFPNANIGVATGPISGLLVLDIDAKDNRSSKEFLLPVTACSNTGGGGEHFLFKYPKFEVRNSAGLLFGKGIDIRGLGGYIVLPPSLHSSGKNYEWKEGCSPFETELADIPKWLEEALHSENKIGKKPAKKWEGGIGGVGQGSRNDTGTSMAGKILSSMDPKMWEKLGLEQFQIWNNKNTPPLDEKELSTIWESVKQLHIDSMEKEVKEDPFLKELCEREDVTLFHNEQNDAYIAIDIKGHREVMPCKSKSMKRLLSKMYWDKNKKAMSGEYFRNVLTVLEGLACFEGPEIKLENRVALHNNILYYDLTNERWQVVRIDNDGWRVDDKHPIIFKRHSHHKAQMTPAKGGDVRKILEYVNIKNEEHRLLFLVSIIASFIPNFPHPMLIVFGNQGSAKSTLSRLMRLLIDPSMIEIMGLPSSQKELIQILAHHYFLFFDNVSHISEEVSDNLCKAITGAGFSKRELYQDDEDIIYSFRRCIGVNGINLVVNRSDLLERSILLELERLDKKQRKTEGEIYGRFEADLPFILGGIFDVLVEALKRKPFVQVADLPRMADFTLWGCAVAEALGYTKDDFLRAYQNNIVRQTEMLLNDNVVATALVTFIEGTRNKEWEGTPTLLLEQLVTHSDIQNIDTREKYWPKGAQALSRRLNELSTSLRQMGISVVISTHGTERNISIKKMQDPLIAYTTKTCLTIEPPIIAGGIDSILATSKNSTLGDDSEPF